MNPRRRIFFLIFGLYHLFVLIFVLFIESQKEDLNLLYGLYSKLALLRYGALLGLILFGVDAVWHWIEHRNLKREHEALRLENNTLKAKVYDFQEEKKREPVIEKLPPPANP